MDSPLAVYWFILRVADDDDAHAPASDGPLVALGSSTDAELPREGGAGAFHDVVLGSRASR
jgi:hypothetical protein